MQMREDNLGIVLLDALTYHEGWLSEERFAEKLSLGAKQVRTGSSPHSPQQHSRARLHTTTCACAPAI